jgi:Fe-S oxidoreductase
MFKEEEKGKLRVNQERTEDAIESGADVVAVACPFCNTMMTDGIKGKELQDKVKVLDIAELIAQGKSLV